jgi:hypothetical protein
VRRARMATAGGSAGLDSECCTERWCACMLQPQEKCGHLFHSWRLSLRFSFAVRLAIGVAMLVLIGAAYFVTKKMGYPSQLFMSFITAIGAVALVLGSGGRRGACCGRRKAEGEAPRS